MARCEGTQSTAQWPSMSEPLFNSTHAALAFAFSYSERNGRPNMLGSMSEKLRPRTGRGLVGLDGAAMAGMILRHVLADLSELQSAVIVGKFSRPTPCRSCGSFHDTTDRIEAVERLAQYTLTKMQLDRPNLALRRGLVRRYLGDRVKMRDLAQTCGVHQNTASNHDKKVQEILRGIEREAMRALDEGLRELVAQEESA
jgi:hypothetical protein